MLTSLLAACTGDAPRTDADESRPAAARGAWEALPDGPLSPRDRAHAIWTGREAILWGGFGRAEPDGMGAVARRDGARYDPADGTWTAIPDAPIAAGMPGYGQYAFWTGAQLVVIGRAEQGERGWEGARFDPVAERWQEISLPPPLRMNDFEAAWTGRRLVLWTTDPLTGDLRVLAWEPDADEWSELDPPWSGKRHDVRGLWTGEELLLWGGRADSGVETGPGCAVECNRRRAAPRRDVLAWNPERDRWRALPDVPVALATSAHAVWADGHVLLEGRPFREPARWFRWSPEDGDVRALADLPLGTAFGAATWAGDSLLALRVPLRRPTADPRVALLEYRPDRDAWVERPGPPLPVDDGTAAVWTGTRWLLWGGQRIDDRQGEMTVTATARGVAWDPHAPAADPAPEPGDFSVRVEAQVDGPLRLEIRQPGPLPLGGKADWQLVVASSEEILLRAVPEEPTPGVLRSGEGVLVAVGPDAHHAADPAHPELGIQVHDAHIVPQGHVLPDRPVVLPMTLIAQEPPFAPAEGEYSQDVPLQWWRARPPGTAYPVEPDGELRLRLRYHVRALTPEGAAPRTGQDLGQVALDRPPCHPDAVALGVGDTAGDAMLTVEADLLGWFGQYAYGAPMAGYRPTASAQERTFVGESLVLVNGRALRECVHPTFAFDADPVDEEDESGTRTGVVEMDGLTIEVAQQVRWHPATHEFVQRYTFRNAGEATVPLRLTRRMVYADTPMHPRSLTEAGLAEASPDGEILRVRSDGGAGPVIEIAGDLDGRARPDDWAVWRHDVTVSARHDVEPMLDDGLPPERAGVVHGDADGDGRADSAFQPALAQTWRTTVAPGAAVVLTVVTRFLPPA